MSRISCVNETACREIAQLQEALVVDAITWTVVGVVAIAVVSQIVGVRRGDE